LERIVPGIITIIETTKTSAGTSNREPFQKAFGGCEMAGANGEIHSASPFGSVGLEKVKPDFIGENRRGTGFARYSGFKTKKQPGND
jgi:hypothetical protein